MANTSLADIIYTDAFASYYKRASTTKSALITSGVVSRDERIAAAAAACPTGARLVNLPYWEDLTGDPQPLIDGQSLGTSKIDLNNDVAIVMRNGKGWAISDRAIERAKSDPIRSIADQLVNYWNRETQKDLFALLKGVFASNLANNDGDHVLNISGLSGDAAVLNKNSIIMASQLLGDHKDELTAIAMHSMAESVLNQAENSATSFRPSTTPGELAQYNGKSIIMDDMCGYNPETGVAEIYLFGRGAVALNPVPTEHETEADRDKAAGVNKLYSRRGNILHVRGVKWVDGDGYSAEVPTRSDLQNAAHHLRVWEPKDVRVVKLIAKVA